MGIFRWGDFGYSGLIGKEFSSQVLFQYDYVMPVLDFFHRPIMMHRQNYVGSCYPALKTELMMRMAKNSREIVQVFLFAFNELRKHIFLGHPLSRLTVFQLQ